MRDHLLTGQFPDWPLGAGVLEGFTPQKCGAVMRDWEKFASVGAIGPDLFYFSQDYNGLPLGPLSDSLMLALSIYYYFDAAKEDDWEPLLIILDGVNSTIAGLLRFLIKLQKIWQSFVDGWNATIGPFVSQAEGLLDALTGGLLSEFGEVIDELKTALKTIGEEELLTFADIFTNFDTCVQKGWGENLFLWSDISHYRKPSALCQAFVQQVRNLQAAGQPEQADQFLSFTLGYITHLGTDTIAHAFVNEQCGGPFRDHPQRHHLIENHIDAWNYSQTAPGKAIAPDPWGYTDTYPDVSMSALWYAVQMHSPSDKYPNGWKGEQRPATLPDDPKARKKALDVDGEMPGWMANAIVQALIDTYAKDDHPRIFQGHVFQSLIDENFLTQAIEAVTGGGGSDKPFPELLAGIAPPPPAGMTVPVGFPLPWEMQTMYKIMITFYKFSYTGSWELQKPRKPDFIIFPPASDFENLLQPPDFSGIDPSNPVSDICGVFVALFDWAIKVLEAAGQLVEDLIKMIASPGSYLFRLGLYELAMMVWDIITKTHEILAHSGFMAPHSEQVYSDNGELRLPNEIDIPLITLGGTVDAAFRAALGSAIDPFGNLDKNQDVIGTGHPIPDDNYPYYPVLKYGSGAPEGFEFHRPWAFPNVSVSGSNNAAVPTPTETYDQSKAYVASYGYSPPPLPAQGDPKPATGKYKPLRAGPYPAGTMPDVFFRLDAPVDAEVRSAYEMAQTPFDTDQLNEAHISSPRALKYSPLGDPIPFSAHLIAQIVNDTGYSTQFNLDSDRAFAYLTWDWVRGDSTKTGILGLSYHLPVEPPAGADGWALGNNPLQLHYVDRPKVAAPPPPPPPPRLR